jgi:hypothetical protein
MPHLAAGGFVISREIFDKNGPSWVWPGNWLPWLEKEFGWSRQTADRFLAVFDASLKLPDLSNLDLPVSGLYLLAAPSTPDEVRNETETFGRDDRHNHRCVVWRDRARARRERVVHSACDAGASFAGDHGGDSGAAPASRRNCLQQSERPSWMRARRCRSRRSVERGSGSASISRSRGHAPAR